MKVKENFNMNHKRIILVGKAASGKDYARKVFQRQGFKYAVSYTTRPPRPDEIDSIDYFFISQEEANRMIQENEFYEYVIFNGWVYGTSKKQFYEDDIFIMTPKGLSHLSIEDRKQSVVFYFDINEETRLNRLKNRNMIGDSLERRLASDAEDFKDFNNYDIKITNSNF